MFWFLIDCLIKSAVMKTVSKKISASTFIQRGTVQQSKRLRCISFPSTFANLATVVVLLSSREPQSLPGHLSGGHLPSHVLQR